MEQNEQELNIVIEDGVLKQFDKAYEGEYVVPFGVTSIQHHAFIECEKLTGISIPASVESIGELAFSGCSRLMKITVDKDNPVYDSRENCCAIIETVSDTLVVGCYNTKVPEGIKRIGENAFDGACFLEDIIIPDSVRVIDEWAFFKCYDLKYIYLPDSLEIIGDAAFYECESLEEIHLPESLKRLGNGAFCLCVGLKRIHIPASVRLVMGADRLLAGCESVQHISVDADNRYYDSRENCNAIIESANNRLIEGCENTLIPNTVVSIANKAFSSSDIMAVIIPESVRHIGKNIFDSCEVLAHIVVSRSNPVYDSREDCNAIIHSASNTLICGCKNTVIPNGVSVIDECAFFGCRGLTTINIPNSVHTIKEYAFAHCKNLTKIEIPDSVTSINANAFHGCDKLVISIPSDSKYDIGHFSGVKKVVKRKAKGKK
jgi:hypothetical protein